MKAFYICHILSATSFRTEILGFSCFFVIALSVYHNFSKNAIKLRRNLSVFCEIFEKALAISKKEYYNKIAMTETRQVALCFQRHGGR